MAEYEDQLPESRIVGPTTSSRLTCTGVVLALVTCLGLAQKGEAKSSPLEQDFRISIGRGITFFFFESPDEGIYLTLRGSTALFRYLDGKEADGSLQKRVDKGTFRYDNGRVTLRGACLTKDVILTLKPFDAKSTYTNGSKARVLLTGPDFPFGGYGPVDDVPAKRRPSPFLIKQK